MAHTQQHCTPVEASPAKCSWEIMALLLVFLVFVSELNVWVDRFVLVIVLWTENATKKKRNKNTSTKRKSSYRAQVQQSVRH